MPAVKKKGQKKGKKIKDSDDIERTLVFKDTLQLQEYAQVVKLLGNCRCEVNCVDGTTRLAHIRGNMRKKVWIKAGDIVIVSLREYEDAKCDIIYLYKLRESKKLKIYKEIPESFKINEDMLENVNEEDIGVDFETEDDKKNKEDMEKEEFNKNFEQNFYDI